MGEWVDMQNQIYECENKEDEIEEMKELVKRGMETVVNLKVPLIVEMGFGVNWYDLK